MNQRLISTKFWHDSYIAELDPTEKLLFLYLLTNPDTNIAGIYELNIRRMAFDTGIDKEMILKVLERFQKDGKVHYYSGYVIMINWLKHQNTNSPKVMQGLNRILSELPQSLIQYLYSMDTVWIPSLKLNLTKLNLTERENETVPGENTNTGFIPEDSQVPFEEFGKAQLFSKSKYENNQELFTNDFKARNIAAFDPAYYYNAVRNWSASKNKRSCDWVAEASRWAENDLRQDKAVMKKAKSITQSNL